jgi:membrane protein YdbS with pleckstrin-like domain
MTPESTFDLPAAPDVAWQPLPPRARTLFMLTDASVLAVGLGVGPGILAGAFDVASPLLAGVLGAILGALAGMAIGTRRHRRTRWLLDADGLAVARGNWWRRETRVPASRVQHIDLKHGPLERRWRLSTVVVHTAGSKMGAVSLSGLDADDAEGLRDRLARQADDDDAS